MSNPFATPANLKAPRCASSSGFTPSSVGFCARFRFRQLASSPSRTRKGTTLTFVIAFASRLKNSRPTGLFKSCTTGSVLSPSSAKPPVPDARFVASACSSSRNAPMLTMRKLPHASIATVASDRRRRRVALRMPRLVSVRFAAASDRSSLERNADVKAIAALSSSAPAPKKIPAAAESCFAQAVPISASAESRQTAPITNPRMLFTGADARGSSPPPASSSLAGRFACLRSASHSVNTATSTLPKMPPASVAGSAWKFRSLVPTASRQTVESAWSIARAYQTPPAAPSNDPSSDSPAPSSRNSRRTCLGVKPSASSVPTSVARCSTPN